MVVCAIIFGVEGDPASRPVPGSEEFMAVYAMALAAVPDQREIGASKTLPGMSGRCWVPIDRKTQTT